MTPSPGTPPRRRRRGLATAAVLAVGFAAAAAAQTGDQAETPESLQQRLEAGRGREAALKQQLKTGLQEEKTLRERKRAATEKLAQITRRRIAAARELQGKEAVLTTLEQDLAGLYEKNARMQVELETRLGQRRQVLGAILRIARFPPEAMLVLRAPPIDTVRGLMVFATLEPVLRDEAARVKADLRRLAAVRAEKARKRKQVAKATAELEVEKANLERLQAEKAALVERTGKVHRASVRQNRGTATKLSKQAKSIGELIELIEKRNRQRQEAARRAAEKAKTEAPDVKVPAAAIPKPGGLLDFTREKGSLWPPVQGRVVRQYGDKDEFGATSKGIVLEGRAGAQVVAPFDGEVVFAGPFRGYGRILLIEHGGGYHTLLAGLGRIDSVPGQWLLAGEPVAVMGDAEAGRTRLYVEFRRDGRPINPRPYMAVAQN
jgi:septal ring factor EnvC (AmiA/AmiB activator)